MIKIKCEQKTGRPLILLGLSHANLDRLRAEGLKGRIGVDGAELGIDVDIWITAAETEQMMFDAFQDGIREGTKLHIDPRLKS